MGPICSPRRFFMRALLLAGKEDKKVVEKECRLASDQQGACRSNTNELVSIKVVGVCL